MPFTDFPHAPAPQLPPLLMRSASTAERPALPLHPLLQPIRSSRSYAEPAEHAESPDEPDQRRSIHQLLNSERWAHHRTLVTLRNETARRDQLDQQILFLKQECQALASEWSAATNDFVQCDTERLELVREVQSLRSELETWKLACKEQSGAHIGIPIPLSLDMTTANERQSALRNRKATKDIFPMTANTRSSSLYEDATVKPLFAHPKSAGV
ncbi:hypothetical protein Q7P37_008915 [Cladosporium fusiforme]